jgi:hypothetical protein
LLHDFDFVAVGESIDHALDDAFQFVLDLIDPVGLETGVEKSAHFAMPGRVVIDSREYMRPAFCLEHFVDDRLGRILARDAKLPGAIRKRLGITGCRTNVFVARKHIASGYRIAMHRVFLTQLFVRSKRATQYVGIGETDLGGGSHAALSL